MNVLRKLRTSLAVLFFLAVTLLFLDFTGTVHSYLGWTAKVQFFPALLALNLGVIIALLILTVLFGRIYCSVICPLGVYQDFIFKLRKKRKVAYHKAYPVLRYSFLGVFIAALVMGIGSIVAFFEPYSIFGRFCANLFQPIYKLGNNFLAFIAERADSYAFYSSEVVIASWSLFAVAAFMFVIITVTAYKGGRDYCNMICPVGTILGFVSRFSIFKIRIDHDKCNGCQKCTRECKAKAIETKTREIDYSRCVDCFDCIDSCNKGAISFGLSPKKKAEAKKEVDSSKRNMLAVSAALLASTAVKAEGKLIDGGYAFIEDKKAAERQTPVVPAGSLSAKKFSASCTGCQLCVSVCENNVLRSSTDFKNFMQPTMSFEKGYCRPECTKCSDVCPAGAINPISIDEKSSTQIGQAHWIEKNCLAVCEGISCDNCATQCPTGAIRMIKPKDDKYNGVKIPMINANKCIGCGACEYLCPARPFSAIYVEGHRVHKTI